MNLFAFLAINASGDAITGHRTSLDAASAMLDEMGFDTSDVAYEVNSQGFSRCPGVPGSDYQLGVISAIRVEG